LDQSRHQQGHEKDAGYGKNVWDIHLPMWKSPVFEAVTPNFRRGSPENPKTTANVKDSLIL
jgi:hypothetical protein